MAKIIISLNGALVQEVPISKERITIGRREHNDVVIEHRSVSGEHAVIISGTKDIVLEDLNSTNGTLVNGQPIKRHFLQDQDIIELAKYRITYIGNAKPAPRVASSQPAVIKVLMGQNAGKVLVLNKQLTTLGRPGEVAAITRSGQQYCLAYVEGSQHLMLNGAAVGKEPVPLHDGDVIQFAGTEMTFLCA